jgi:hypothetical protein
VTLFEDLKCADNAPTTDPFVDDCAIKLSGPKAVLNCKNFMIHQATSSLGWDHGICLYNGARAKNCYVQKFEELGVDGAGIYIKNGGEVKDSEVMFNYRGVRVEASQGSTTKISNTYVSFKFIVHI